MSASRIASDGKITQLDARAGARETVTEADVQEPPKLARLLTRVLADVAGLLRRAAPSRIDFEDVPTLDAGGTVSLQHNFGGRVRWWIVDCATATSAWLDASTTSDTLVLNVVSTGDGKCTVRVEAAG